MSLLGRLLDPAPLWEQSVQRLAHRRRVVLLRVLAIAVAGALGAALAVEGGARLVTTHESVAFGFLPRPGGPQHPFLITFVGVLATPFVLALSFLVLARAYQLALRPLAALVVAVYGALPVYATLLLMWTPAAIVLVAAAFVVSLIWWGAGIRRLLDVPADESAPFIGVALLVALVASQLLGALLASLA